MYAIHIRIQVTSESNATHLDERYEARFNLLQIALHMAENVIKQIRAVTSFTRII